MPNNRTMAANYDNLGKLVKSWVLGENRVNFPGGAPPLPQSLQELKDQCNRADVGLTLPDGIKAVQFIPTNDETLVIRLPSANKVREAETAIKADPTNYPLPAFYKARYSGQEPTMGDAADALDLQESRIGDYTIAECI